jgi:hypothetical protein
VISQLMQRGFVVMLAAFLVASGAPNHAATPNPIEIALVISVISPVSAVVDGVT